MKLLSRTFFFVNTVIITLLVALMVNNNNSNNNYNALVQASEITKSCRGIDSTLLIGGDTNKRVLALPNEDNPITLLDNPLEGIVIQGTQNVNEPPNAIECYGVWIGTEDSDAIIRTNSIRFGDAIQTLSTSDARHSFDLIIRNVICTATTILPHEAVPQSRPESGSNMAYCISIPATVSYIRSIQIYNVTWEQTNSVPGVDWHFFVVLSNAVTNFVSGIFVEKCRMSGRFAYDGTQSGRKELALLARIGPLPFESIAAISMQDNSFNISELSGEANGMYLSASLARLQWIDGTENFTAFNNQFQIDQITTQSVIYSVGIAMFRFTGPSDAPSRPGQEHIQVRSLFSINQSTFIINNAAIATVAGRTDRGLSVSFLSFEERIEFTGPNFVVDDVYVNLNQIAGSRNVNIDALLIRHATNEFKVSRLLLLQNFNIMYNISGYETLAVCPFHMWAFAKAPRSRSKIDVRIRDWNVNGTLRSLQTTSGVSDDGGCINWIADNKFEATGQLNSYSSCGAFTMFGNSPENREADPASTDSGISNLQSTEFTRLNVSVKLIDLMPCEATRFAKVPFEYNMINIARRFGDNGVTAPFELTDVNFDTDVSARDFKSSCNSRDWQSVPAAQVPRSLSVSMFRSLKGFRRTRTISFSRILSRLIVNRPVSSTARCKSSWPVSFELVKLGKSITTSVEAIVFSDISLIGDFSTGNLDGLPPSHDGTTSNDHLPTVRGFSVFQTFTATTGTDFNPYATSTIALSSVSGTLTKILVDSLNYHVSISDIHPSKQSFYIGNAFRFGGSSLAVNEILFENIDVNLDILQQYTAYTSDEDPSSSSLSSSATGFESNLIYIDSTSAIFSSLTFGLSTFKITNVNHTAQSAGSRLRSPPFGSSINPEIVKLLYGPILKTRILLADNEPLFSVVFPFDLGFIEFSHITIQRHERARLLPLAFDDAFYFKISAIRIASTATYPPFIEVFDMQFDFDFESFLAISDGGSLLVSSRIAQNPPSPFRIGILGFSGSKEATDNSLEKIALLEVTEITANINVNSTRDAFQFFVFFVEKNLHTVGRIVLAHVHVNIDLKRNVLPSPILYSDSNGIDKVYHYLPTTKLVLFYLNSIDRDTDDSEVTSSALFTRQNTLTVPNLFSTNSSDVVLSILMFEPKKFTDRTRLDRGLIFEKNNISIHTFEGGNHHQSFMERTYADHPTMIVSFIVRCPDIREDLFNDRYVFEVDSSDPESTSTRGGSSDSRPPYENLVISSSKVEITNEIRRVVASESSASSSSRPLRGSQFSIIVNIFNFGFKTAPIHYGGITVPILTFPTLLVEFYRNLQRSQLNSSSPQLFQDRANFLFFDHLDIQIRKIELETVSSIKAVDICGLLEGKSRTGLPPSLPEPSPRSSMGFKMQNINVDISDNLTFVGSVSPSSSSASLEQNAIGIAALRYGMENIQEIHLVDSNLNVPMIYFIDTDIQLQTDQYSSSSLLGISAFYFERNLAMSLQTGASNLDVNGITVTVGFTSSLVNRNFLQHQNYRQLAVSTVQSRNSLFSKRPKTVNISFNVIDILEGSHLVRGESLEISVWSMKTMTMPDGGSPFQTGTRRSLIEKIDILNNNINFMAKNKNSINTNNNEALLLSSRSSSVFETNSLRASILLVDERFPLVVQTEFNFESNTLTSSSSSSSSSEKTLALRSGDPLITTSDIDHNMKNNFIVAIAFVDPRNTKFYAFRKITADRNEIVLPNLAEVFESSATSSIVIFSVPSPSCSIFTQLKIDSQNSFFFDGTAFSFTLNTIDVHLLDVRRKFVGSATNSKVLLQLSIVDDYRLNVMSFAIVKIFNVLRNTINVTDGIIDHHTTGSGDSSSSSSPSSPVTEYSSMRHLQMNSKLLGLNFTAWDSDCVDFYGEPAPDGVKVPRPAAIQVLDGIYLRNNQIAMARLPLSDNNNNNNILRPEFSIGSPQMKQYLSKFPSSSSSSSSPEQQQTEIDLFRKDIFLLQISGTQNAFAVRTQSMPSEDPQRSWNSLLLYKNNLNTSALDVVNNIAFVALRFLPGSSEENNPLSLPSPALSNLRIQVEENSMYRPEQEKEEPKEETSSLQLPFFRIAVNSQPGGDFSSPISTSTSSSCYLASLSWIMKCNYFGNDYAKAIDMYRQVMYCAPRTSFTLDCTGWTNSVSRSLPSPSRDSNTISPSSSITREETMSDVNVSESLSLSDRTPSRSAQTPTNTEFNPNSSTHEETLTHATASQTASSSETVTYEIPRFEKLQPLVNEEASAVLSTFAAAVPQVSGAYLAMFRANQLAKFSACGASLVLEPLEWDSNPTFMKIASPAVKQQDKIRRALELSDPDVREQELAMDTHRGALAGNAIVVVGAWFILFVVVKVLAEKKRNEDEKRLFQRKKKQRDERKMRDQRRRQQANNNNNSTVYDVDNVEEYEEDLLPTIRPGNDSDNDGEDDENVNYNLQAQGTVAYPGILASLFTVLAPPCCYIVTVVLVVSESQDFSGLIYVLVILTVTLFAIVPIIIALFLRSKVPKTEETENDDDSVKKKHKKKSGNKKFNIADEFRHHLEMEANYDDEREARELEEIVIGHNNNKNTNNKYSPKSKKKNTTQRDDDVDEKKQNQNESNNNQDIEGVGKSKQELIILVPLPQIVEEKSQHNSTARTGRSLRELAHAASTARDQENEEANCRAPKLLYNYFFHPSHTWQENNFVSRWSGAFVEARFVWYVCYDTLLASAVGVFTAASFSCPDRTCCMGLSITCVFLCVFHTVFLFIRKPYLCRFDAYLNTINSCSVSAISVMTLVEVIRDEKIDVTQAKSAAAGGDSSAKEILNVVTVAIAYFLLAASFLQVAIRGTIFFYRFSRRFFVLCGWKDTSSNNETSRHDEDNSRSNHDLTAAKSKPNNNNNSSSSNSASSAVVGGRGGLATASSSSPSPKRPLQSSKVRTQQDDAENTNNSSTSPGRKKRSVRIIRVPSKKKKKSNDDKNNTRHDHDDDDDDDVNQSELSYGGETINIEDLKDDDYYATFDANNTNAKANEEQQKSYRHDHEETKNRTNISTSPTNVKELMRNDDEKQQDEPERLVLLPGSSDNKSKISPSSDSETKKRKQRKTGPSESSS